jgi:hypothetical protein
MKSDLSEFGVNERNGGMALHRLTRGGTTRDNGDDIACHHCLAMPLSLSCGIVVVSLRDGGWN